MTHVYNFDLYKHPIPANVHFVYTAEHVIPNDTIKEITTLILTHAASLWLEGNNQCMDDAINLSILRSRLTAENKHDIVEWLAPFTSLTLRNGDKYEFAGDIYVKLE